MIDLFVFFVGESKVGEVKGFHVDYGSETACFEVDGSWITYVDSLKDGSANSHRDSMIFSSLLYGDKTLYLDFQRTVFGNQTYKENMSKMFIKEFIDKSYKASSVIDVKENVIKPLSFLLYGFLCISKGCEEVIQILHPENEDLIGLRFYKIADHLKGRAFLFIFFFFF